MKSNLNVMMVVAVTGVAMTGCLAGQNQQFFDTVSGLSDTSGPSSTGGSNAGPDLGSGSSGTPTPTPSLVCDPFGSSPTTGQATTGLKAEMYYYNDSDVGVKPANSVSDLINNGHKANADFYFSDLYVPTRSFDQGFQLSDGSLLARDDGSKLFEWFAFKYKTSIRLPQGSGTKLKQFAILSDDGSYLSIQDPVTQQWSTQLSNDGQHSTRMGCGQTPIAVSSEYSTSFEIGYFQGPRVRIAMILLWRDWEGSAFDPNDPWCGQSGDATFFDGSVAPSVPKNSFIDIMTRWEVVPANVFFIDDANTANPCN